MSEVGALGLCVLAAAEDLQGTQWCPQLCMSQSRDAAGGWSLEGFQLQAGHWTDFSAFFKKCFRSSRETVYSRCGGRTPVSHSGWTFRKAEKRLVLLYFSLDFLLYSFPASIVWFFLSLFFWLRWVFISARALSGLLLIAGCGLLIAAASLCCRAWALGMRTSVVAACGLQ